MHGRFGYQLLTAAALAVLFAVAPSTVFAQNGDADADSKEFTTSADSADSNTVQEDDAEVQLEDMLRSENPTEASSESSEETLRQDTGDQDTDMGWTGVLARNSLAGGITGGLVGAAVTLIRGEAFDIWYIGQFAGAGILVGLTVGAIQLLAGAGSDDADALQHQLDDTAEPPATLELMERQMPETYDTKILRIEF